MRLNRVGAVAKVSVDFPLNEPVMKPTDSRPTPQAVCFAAADGYPLHGHLWRCAAPERHRAVVVINPATAVHSRYYARFAAFLHGRGLDVLTYDYRGIGGSRPASLRGLRAGWLEWGELDFEGALRWLEGHCPGQPVLAVGHSAGGLLLGLAESNRKIVRSLTVGAQFAYWRDYARDQRWSMWWKWHVLMPALTAVCGYFPGRRLGWLEDTPQGVVRDWTSRHPRFEHGLGRGRARSADRPARLIARSAALGGELLALSASDDPFATVPAVQRLLGYFTGSRRCHLQLEPARVGVASIGHFAFFHARFADSLWPLAGQWLQQGSLPAAVPGEWIAPHLPD